MVVSGSLEQDTSIKPTSESAEMRMIDFFMILNCLFNNNSSQVASPDVLERRILLFGEGENQLPSALCVLRGEF